MLKHSNHSKYRSQQRGIPNIVHEWLSDYGKELHDGHGGIRVFFDHKSIRKMKHNFGKKFIQENKKYLNAYRIESGDCSVVITTGWLTGRIKNR